MSPEDRKLIGQVAESRDGDLLPPYALEHGETATILHLVDLRVMPEPSPGSSWAKVNLLARGCCKMWLRMNP